MDVLLAFTLGALAASFSHLRTPIMTILPVVAYTTRLGCRRVRKLVLQSTAQILGEIPDEPQTPVVLPKLSRPKRVVTVPVPTKEESTESQDEQDEKEKEQEQEQVSQTSVEQSEAHESNEPVWTSKKTKTRDWATVVQVSDQDPIFAQIDGCQLCDVENRVHCKFCASIQQTIEERLSKTSSAIREELDTKTVTGPIKLERDLVSEAVAIDLLISNRKDNHENSLAEEVLTRQNSLAEENLTRQNDGPL